MKRVSGASRTTDAKEILYARQKVVAVAKAYGLQAIDMVHINFKGEPMHSKYILESQMDKKFILTSREKSLQNRSVNKCKKINFSILCGLCTLLFHVICARGV